MHKPIIIILLLASALFCTSCGIFMDITLIRDRAPELFVKEKHLSKHAGDSLANIGTVVYGQTRSQVIRAWGRPESQSGCSINKDSRRLVQMKYPDRFAYVYLLGNRVCAIDPLDKYEISEDEPEE